MKSALRLFSLLCVLLFLTLQIHAQVVSPKHVGSLVDGTGGALLTNPFYTYVSGNYAYVVGFGSNSLEIVNVSNPAAPLHVGNIVNGSGGAIISSPRYVCVVGNYAYVGGANAIEIVDVSNPASPVHKGSLVDGGGVAPYLSGIRSIHVSGNYAYVASSSSNAIEIVNISNPASPTHVGSIIDGGGGAALLSPRSVFVSGSLAYIASYGSNALEIIDVSNPASPTHVGKIVDGGGVAPFLSGPFSIYVSGSNAYIASYLSGALEIIDVSTPASPIHKGSIVDGGGSTPFLSGAHSVFVSGNYAYVASLNSNALEIIDTSNSSSPTHAGSVQNGTGAALLSGVESVFVIGNYAYMASYSSNALEIVSIFASPVSSAASSVSASGFTANWTSVSGALSYQLDVSSDNFSTFLPGYNSASVAGSPQVISGLAPGTTYQYRVRAVYSIGPSASSNVISVGTLTVQANQATSITSSGFTANWNSIAGATGYQLDVSTDNFSTFVIGYNSLSVAGTSQLVTGLLQGTSYQYRVRAVTPAGISGNSNTIFATTGVGSSPGSSFALNVTHEGSIGPDGTAFYASSVSVSGNYAYVLGANGGKNGLYVFDISNPASPSIAGSILDGGGSAPFLSGTSIYVSGNYAYVTGSSVYNALEIVDITNPLAPVHAGSLVDGGGAAPFLKNPRSVFISGIYAYVASDGSSALEIVDISNPNLPVHKGSLINGVGGALLSHPNYAYVSGNYAYVASGSGSSALEIVDVTNPASPVHAGSLTNGTGGAVLLLPVAVYVSGNYAYVANDNSNNVEIVDVSNPTSPVHVSSIADGGGTAPFLKSPNSVFVNGNYAYVASSGSNALEVINISNPSAPTHAGSISNGSGGASLNAPNTVFVSGNYAYLTTFTALEIVSISTPTTPTHKGNYVSTFGQTVKLVGPVDVFVAGNYAYVTSSDALEIVDVSNPANPTHKGSLVDGNGVAPFLANGYTVFVSGNLAYVTSNNRTTNSGALEIVDVTNPSAPVHKGSIVNGAGGASLKSAWGLYVSGNYAYVADQQGPALEIINVSNPAAPAHAGKITLTNPTSVFVVGNNAYVADGNSLKVIDVSNPATPVIIGNLADGGGTAPYLSYPQWVIVKGNYAYLPSYGSNQALEVVDISNPAAPVHKSALLDGNGAAPFINNVNYFSISGNYAYIPSYSSVSNPSGALEVIDISNPAAPVHAGSITDGTGGAKLFRPWSVYASGNYAYVTGSFSALEIVSVFSPATPPVATTASHVNISGFTAKWNSVNGASGYELDLSQDNFTTFISGYNAKSESGTSDVVTGLNPKATYQYRVRATDASGASSNSNVITVTTNQDSLDLVTIYNSSNGPGWTNKTNWLTGPLSSWYGVTVVGGRVTQLNLSNNNLSGAIPAAITDLDQTTSVNLSSNQIKSLPDLTALPNLATLDVSSNALDFASLIANAAITGINYPNQADIGTILNAKVDVGTNYKVGVFTAGNGNTYQWTRNGTAVPGATDSTFVITSINRSNMGTYICEITNPAVPGLTLKTKTKIVLATAKLSGKFVLPDSTRITSAKILLFRINAVGAYDTLANQPISSDGTFLLDKVVLDDYELAGNPDTVAFPTVIPTFYKSTIFWEVADTLSIFGNRTGLNIIGVEKPSPPKGIGSISGTLEEEAKVGGGRVLAKARVAGAGVVARRIETSGRIQAKKYILVEYAQTNENGEFILDQLPTDNYQLNIQYPGYPMDTTSFVNFTIGDLPSTKEVIVSAEVLNNQIVVTLLKITGLSDADKRFSIYPNPTKLVINVDLNSPQENVEYLISTLQGRKVKEGTLTGDQNQINVATLSRGIYIVQLISNGEVIKTFRAILE